MNDTEILARHSSADKTQSSVFSGREVLVVFARAPIPGQVKTRLAAKLGEEKAAQLYAAMLRDTLEIAQGAARVALAETVLAHTPQEALSLKFPDAYSLRHFWSGNCSPQGEGDLSARLLRCFRRHRMRGFSHVIIIGSDAPDLPPAYLSSALTALRNSDLVFGPTQDGGFYLIGTSCPLRAALFRGVRWSTARVLEQILINAARLKISAALLDCWRDVDEIEDLRALAARLRNGESCAPHTQSTLAQIASEHLS